MTAAIARIERYAVRGRAVFDAEELVRGWLEYQLILLGEAARRLGEHHPGYHAAHPEVPWGAIIGMRNVLIHQYHRIDADVVWQTVVDDLPRIRMALDDLMSSTR
jgi:uncharacterized protein with HEPN domain